MSVSRHRTTGFPLYFPHQFFIVESMNNNHVLGATQEWSKPMRVRSLAGELGGAMAADLAKQHEGTNVEVVAGDDAEPKNGDRCSGRKRRAS
jgi:hypothetical protein